MSVKALTWAFEQPVNATEKVVLLALADHADEHGVCWPSISLLVKRAHVGERTVQRAIQSLEDNGFVIRERRVRENGSDTSNLYRLMLSKVSQSVSAEISVDQRGSRGVKLAPHEGGVTQTGGEGVTQTGGEDGLDDTPRTIIKNRQKEPSDISYDEGFAEFWAAYPKRPNNSKAAAKKKYILARKNKVPHVIIMAGLRDYAAMRNKAVAEGDSPHFTQMAETWLNKAGWENDYSIPNNYQAAVQSSAPMASDEDLDAVIKFFPGHVGKRDEAKKLLAAEMTGGVTLQDICVAAEKYKLFCKGPPYEDRKTTPSMLEPWLKFKWREMEAYEFCRVGADRIRTVRPIQRKP